MILKYIWERFIFKEGLKVLLFFTFSFYFLYVLIDYSVHARSFSHAHFSFFDICFYYFCHFTKRAGIILPFALLVACLKVLTSLNTKRELIALLAGGIALHRVMRPLLLLAFLTTAFLYLNAEVLFPFSEKSLKRIEERETVIKEELPSNRLLNSLSMKDGSTLVYQFFDNAENSFFDAFWLENSNTIYRIKYLTPQKIPQGRYVDKLVRNKEGRFILSESFETHAFPNMYLDEVAVQENIIPPTQESITTLISRLSDPTKKISNKPEVIASLSYKLLMPLLAFFVLIIPAPYCLKYGRNLPLFFIYAVTIFGFVTVVTIIGASLIIAENAIFNPFWVIFTPFLLLSLYSFKTYVFSIKRA